MVQFQVLADVLSQQTVVDQFLPVMLELGKDPVPNVRFNVAKTLQKVGHVFDAKWVPFFIIECF